VSYEKTNSLIKLAIKFILKNRINFLKGFYYLFFKILLFPWVFGSAFYLINLFLGDASPNSYKLLIAILVFIVIVWVFYSFIFLCNLSFFFGIVFYEKITETPSINKEKKKKFQ